MKEHCTKKYSASGKSIPKLRNVSCRADRYLAVTECSWRKSQYSSLKPENLSPSLGYRIVNSGYLELESNLSNFEAPSAGPAKPSHSESEACYNNSTFDFSGSGLISPPWLRGDSETTKDEAVNAPCFGWELNNLSFGTTKVGSITPLHTELGISSPSLEPSDPGYMRIRTTHSIFETACLMSGSTLDWDQATWKLNEDEYAED
jgi:hypothetical protein